jgi:hypothetical protein
MVKGGFCFTLKLCYLLIFNDLYFRCLGRQSGKGKHT